MEELKGFDAYEGKIILGYSWQKRNGLIVPTAPEIKIPKVNKKYFTWADKLNTLEPREYEESEFNKSSEEEILESVVYVIVNLLGENALESFNDFLDSIEIINIPNVLDGVVLETLDPKTNQRVMHKTCIPNINVEAHVIVLVHEFIHYYCKMKKVEDTRKQFYLEILSTFSEKYSIEKLRTVVTDKDFEKKMTNNRLAGMLYHFTEVPKFNKEVIDTYHFSKKIGNVELQNKLEELLPWLISNKTIEDMWDYRACMRDSYGLGYLYSDALLEKCLDDEKNVTGTIKKYIDGDMTIEEVLKYYDIRPDKFELYDKSYNRAKAILKK